ncbi:CDP-glycerol glycerophosphotransferase family protein [Ancylomarina salipaludis]|nr:CDP-glycerol glycerophosphotransferase family protein [Ancylomarina salipaludis]
MIRKDKRIALFFLTEKYYYDNSKYLFEYMRQKEDFRSVLFTANKALYTSLQEKFPGEVVYAWSLKGLFLFLRTKNVIISYGISAAPFFPYYLHEKCKNVIYLGHGTPMKKMGLQTEVWQKHGKRYQMQKYSYMVGCSPLEQELHKAGFDMNIDDVWVSGLPRNDYLLSATKDETWVDKYPYLNQKVILYAPTWREETQSAEFFPFPDFDSDQLDAFLEKKQAYILLRGHKEDIKRADELSRFDVSKMKRVLKADQDLFPDVYELLPYVDILVTDYSSIWIDYLLLDRPIIYLPYDLEEYKKSKGLFLDFEKNTPGYKAASLKEFVSQIEIYLQHPSEHAGWRKNICDMYHTHQDGNSSERLYQLIKELNQ